MSVQAHHTRQIDSGTARLLADGLGWFSIGLGLAELLAPRAVARGAGMEGSETMLRACGAREIVTGVGILWSRDPKPWMWGRVAGDAIDLAALATGLKADNPRRGNAGLALAAVAGVTVLDVICAASLGRRQDEPSPALMRDYGARRGLPRPPGEMRGAARDFQVPADMRIPEPLRPYAADSRPS